MPIVYTEARLVAPPQDREKAAAFYDGVFAALALIERSDIVVEPLRRRVEQERREFMATVNSA